jgi:hypothetical protein
MKFRRENFRYYAASRQRTSPPPPASTTSGTNPHNLRDGSIAFAKDSHESRSISSVLQIPPNRKKAHNNANSGNTSEQACHKDYHERRPFICKGISERDRRQCLYRRIPVHSLKMRVPQLIVGRIQSWGLRRKASPRDLRRIQEPEAGICGRRPEITRRTANQPRIPMA